MDVHMTVGKRNIWITIVAILLILGGIINCLISVPWFQIRLGLSQGGPIKSGKVFVLLTNPNSPAEKAGLADRDIILKADGTMVTKSSDLANLTKSFAGKPLSLVIERDGKLQNITLTPRINYPEGEGPTGLVLSDSGVVPESPQKWIPETIFKAYSGQEWRSADPGFYGMFLPPVLYQDKSFSRLTTLIFGCASIALGIGMRKLEKWSLYGYVVLFVAGLFFDFRFALGYLQSFSSLANLFFISLIISGLFRTLICVYLLTHRRLFN